MSIGYYTYECPCCGGTQHTSEPACIYNDQFGDTVCYECDDAINEAVTEIFGDEGVEQ